MRRAVGTAWLLWLLMAGAAACPICFRDAAPTVAQQLAVADRAVVVQVAADGAQRVAAVIKGSEDGGPLQVAVAGAGSWLLLRPTPAAEWTVVGAVAAERAPFLQRVATAAPGDGAADAQWPAYAAALLPYLHDSDALVAGIAYGELARAPYGAMRTLKPRLDAARCAAGIDDPTRQALFTLLAGISGDAQTAALIEQRIDTAWRAKDATNLAALLAADLELRGPARVARIDKMYIADRERTLPEIHAVLHALSAHGDADAAIPRERIVRSYRLFIREHKPMAGYVTHDLAAWHRWDAAPEFLQLLQANALPDPASRWAVAAYLMQSPREDTKAAVRAIMGSSR
ncbi:MAG TPA: hypothetical protein PKB14_09015 [Rubrivivax sp.]|nr:hypothetical protein [Rubrivivax sp.]